MEIPAGVEPACRLIRNQVLVHLSYGTEEDAGERTRDSRPAREPPAGRRNARKALAPLRRRCVDDARRAAVWRWRSRQDLNLHARLNRNQVLLRLSYGTVSVIKRSAPLFASRERRANWLPTQESNLPELGLTDRRVRLARLRGMVELWGIEPHAANLRGWPADHSQSRGARSRFRANLSAVSTRRCHQTSYPGA
jgi:hypothetical protein